MGWLGFWIFLSVFVCCDTYLYSRGHDTMLWKHKTPMEQTTQRKQAE